jgi:alkanesulfonate monooxygenase SsuD/methylene tetrahydromethanopterin reductase-like flavin-dependent oxidoreductase (luciferase family)
LRIVGNELFAAVIRSVKSLANKRDRTRPEESEHLIRVIWTDSPASFTGRHFRANGAYCEPRPDPHPSVLIGGQGQKSMRLVAEKADGWHWDQPIEMYQQPHERLGTHCAATGRDINERYSGHTWFVARGLTRRVQRQRDEGLVAVEILDAAEREADLLEHPYIGLEHLELARLRIAGRRTEYDALKSTLTAGVRRPWWHVRGRHSALRRAGLRATQLARQRAQADEQEPRSRPGS